MSSDLVGVVTGIMAAGGYGGLIVLMAMESACLPLPSEVILPLAGYLVSRGQMNLWAVATAGAIGCNLGSLVAYEVARSGGRAAVMRWGRFVLLTPEDVARADRFFARFGAAAVLIARMLPLVRTFIAAPAGFARMPRLRFHIYTFLGSWPWCLVLAYAGMALGQRWSDDPRLHRLFHYADAFAAAGLLSLIGLFAWRRLRGARRTPAGSDAP